MNKQNIQRVHIEICGTVQGVGFRPFIYNLAKELKLYGWVKNTSYGLDIEAEGMLDKLEKFIVRIQKEKPKISSIYSFKYVFLDKKGFSDFNILESNSSNNKTALILPDIAICRDCINEIFDKNNRRYLYPFTNCTNCGPRYSIIEDLPYDRRNTSMKIFKMCDECRAEYENPRDRRFHAQPNACHKCGPHLEFWDEKKNILSKYEKAISDTVDAIKAGDIVAVKGLGGFHLVVDATNDKAVLRLRQRKNREEKPFALMFNSIKDIEDICILSDIERQILSSTEAPIVLLQKNKNIQKEFISENVSPNNPYLGIMLPYTPLHYILMKKLGVPIIATSANLSDDTICFDEDEAIKRLSGIADFYLIHDRPIVRHVDDSIVRLISGRPCVIRRARGYAPIGIHKSCNSHTILALGAHLKNTIALSVEDNIIISQHIGDLETKKSFDTFKKTGNSLIKLYETNIQNVACDMHPDYLSTKYAATYNVPISQVQHHHAHIVSCMAENNIDDTVLGIAWDGTGYGTDKTIWGGEFLIVSLSKFTRIGYLKTFGLPGGDAAIREIRRIGVSILYSILGNDILNYQDLECVKAFANNEMYIICEMIKKNVNTPMTSSAGRLFDGVSSILGLKQLVSYEGQGAMALEFAIDGVNTDEHYLFDICDAVSSNDKCGFIVNWEKIILCIVNDYRDKVSISEISAKFHNTLVEIIVNAAKRVGKKKVVMSGGCFQNKYLTEKSIIRLREEGFLPYWHQLIPPNDGGISLGQVIAASNAVK